MLNLLTLLVFKEKVLGKPLLKGVLLGGLYNLPTQTKQVRAILSTPAHSSYYAFKSKATDIDRNANVWHNRLGHP